MALLVALTSLLVIVNGVEPNPPVWPSSVSVFSPSMSSTEIEGVVNAAFSVNGGDPLTSCANGQFSDQRFSFLFLPGNYENVDVPVGYYTSVYGLGTSPTDTVFTDGKGVYCEESCGSYETGALVTFWRSAENFHTTSSYTWAVGTGMTWAVSQAAPLRNVKVDNDLLLFEYLDQYCCAAGYASGGWVSGVDVGGSTKFGSQQQFMVRNSRSGSFDNPVWNGVFAGVEGAPASQCGMPDASGNSAQASISVEPNVPLIAEKPYITSADGTSFQLVIPAPQSNVDGVAWTASGYTQASVVDFSDVYVTSPGDTSAVINAKLAAGLHVVVSPGIYNLDSALVVSHKNQVLLGLGMATLISPSNGEPCVRVSDVPGVRIAGLLLEAGAWETKGGMLQVGESGAYAGDAANPVVISDVFARVGGPTNGVGPVDTMFLVQSGYTVIDNTWLWRADHSVDGLVYNGENPVAHGMIVTADNVFAYGLASEHTIEDNVLWEGDNGLTYFYQAEIMYDAAAPTWDYSCYTLGDKVNTHTATGLGCYTYFRDASVYAPTGVNTGGAGNFNIDKAVSVFLNGNVNSGLNNTLNYDGLKVDSVGHVQYRCQV